MYFIGNLLDALVKMLTGPAAQQALMRTLPIVVAKTFPEVIRSMEHCLSTKGYQETERMVQSLKNEDESKMRSIYREYRSDMSSGLQALWDKNLR